MAEYELIARCAEEKATALRTAASNRVLQRRLESQQHCRSPRIPTDERRKLVWRQMSVERSQQMIKDHVCGVDRSGLAFDNTKKRMVGVWQHRGSGYKRCSD